ncbi:YhjD/YihY/BrkB family envelope integrity protein [Streptomyces sp. NPDC046915]|uniref:YhjD/YihY/BrkB family envelope integrity protein n=1 Tax=Streptomyces sp. NPDC046915 TaxID=3155257 RepID=UPI0033E53443
MIRRERVIRTLTFWLRPAFALRVVYRFQRIVGFDRSMALASSALTALIPLGILAGAVFGDVLSNDISDEIISRCGLTGEGAEAVKDLFSSPSGESSSIGAVGSVFLVISALSFARAAQRLFEQAWDLKPLSVRNTRNGLEWLLSVIVYAVAVGWVYAVLPPGRLGLAAATCEVPLTALFLVWSGWILSAKRIGGRDLLPFGVLAAVLIAVYSVGAAVYLPRLFNTYAARYGTVGAVFAMISALFGVMLVVVASAAVGREVRDELARIQQGLEPSENEVRRQWDNVVEQARSSWRSAREQLPHPRNKHQ